MTQVVYGYDTEGGANVVSKVPLSYLTKDNSNYVINPSAEFNSTTGVTVVDGAWTISRSTDPTTFANTYFEITGDTDGDGVIEFSLKPLQAKDSGTSHYFTLEAKLALNSGSGGVYKVDIYDGSALVVGTEFTLVNGPILRPDVLPILYADKTYKVRVRCTAAGNANDRIYLTGIFIGDEQALRVESDYVGAFYGASKAGLSNNSANFGTDLTTEFITVPPGKYIANFGGQLTVTSSVTPTAYIMGGIGLSDGAAAIPGQPSSAAGAIPIVYAPLYAVATLTRGVVNASVTFTVNATTNVYLKPYCGVSGGTVSDRTMDRMYLEIRKFTPEIFAVKNNRVEHASVGGTWDANSTTTVYGPLGSLMGGALTASRLKTITWSTPNKPTHKFLIEAASDPVNGPWLPLNGFSNNTTVTVVNSISSANTRDTNGGYIFMPGTTSDTSRLVFCRYAAVANDDTPSVDWTNDVYWRVTRVDNPMGIGVDLATATKPGALPPIAQMDNSLATTLGHKQYLHGTTYNGGNAPTVTSGQTGFSVNRAVFVPYLTQDGTWRLRFNIVAGFTSATTTSVSASINGVTFKNVANFFQPVIGSQGGNNTNFESYVTPNSGTITIASASASHQNWYVSGDVELDGKPTWAY